MPRPPSDIRTKVVAIVIRQLHNVGAGGITLDRVAGDAGCAKGLVNYHFRTKVELITSAAEELLREREARWQRALEATRPEVAIRQSWQLIVLEASSGFWRAWTSLAASTKVTVQTVNNSQERFTSVVGSAVGALLEQLGLTPTVTRAELGALLAAAVQGLGLQLAAGASTAQLEGAYAALWAAILGLTRPR